MKKEAELMNKNNFFSHHPKSRKSKVGSIQYALICMYIPLA